MIGTPVALESTLLGEPNSSIDRESPERIARAREGIPYYQMPSVCVLLGWQVAKMQSGLVDRE